MLTEYAINRRWGIEEHAAYNAFGQRRHAVVFSSLLQPDSIIFYGLSLEGLVARHIQAYTDGLLPFTFHAYVFNNGVEYGAVWRQNSRHTEFFIDMPLEQLIQKKLDFEQKGYSILRLRSYKNTSMFGAIWGKNDNLS